MSDITKRVDRAIAPTKRSQSFTESDASADDTLLIEASLGHGARKVFIDDVTGGHLDLRFNTRRTVYPDREDGRFQPGMAKNLALGVEFTGNGIGEVIVEEDTTYEMTDEMRVDDIHILSSTTATTFTIFVC